jgi:putative glutamine amidotransferase
MIIGITDPMRDAATFANYENFVRRGSPGVDIRMLSCVSGDFSEISRCDGILLAGGGDVHPKFYDREDALPITHGVSIGRDLFEFDIIREGMDRNLPMLGICRGSQVFNVAMGGSLVPDVLQAGFSVHRSEGRGDRSHGITVEPGTLLRRIAGCDSGTVNSSHHQSADRIGRGLKVSALSEDGVVEAMEWENAEGKPFVLLVQWHPERMEDADSPFAGAIISRFAAEVAARKT